MLLLRKLIAAILFLISFIVSGGIGFVLPDSILMVYHGGFELVYQTRIKLEGPYDYWLPIYVSILGGGCGLFVGSWFWIFGIKKIGLLTSGELKEVIWALNEWGLFGALKKPPQGFDDKNKNQE